MLLLCYSKCGTCKKAKKWLDDHGISYEDREIKTENPTVEELKCWHEKSGLPLKRFFNTSGLRYKDMKLKEKLPTMSEDEQYQLLASDGMLVKRPLVITGQTVLVGFKESQWEETLL
ncbi:arsenate reductase family protein [Ruminococcus sp. OA3]|uniref:arsenate reductase family protein n=1 Tax=Ruminococcus sp. OA3 TaxID=2914164 RepID=UPI001F06544F|nr:arsenate reductase family protein [Ruminococcus sp. OA3]MCH1984335.1 arsenate reductase family protein [Ruminococcus sp. OA3]